MTVQLGGMKGGDGPYSRRGGLNSLHVYRNNGRGGEIRGGGGLSHSDIKNSEDGPME